MFRNIFLGFEATKLTPGSVTLDDLTIDSLKQKMQEIEMKLQGKTSIMIIFQFFNCTMLSVKKFLLSISIDFYIMISECRSKIKEKQTYIIQYETELQTVKFKSDSLSVNRMFSVKKKMDSLKKEVRRYF